MKKLYIVAHPGKQHSFRTASALKEADMLCKYVTTVYNSIHSFSIKLLYRFLPNSEKRRIIERQNPDLSENDVVQYCVLAGYVEIVLSRIRSLRSVYLLFQQINADVFGRKVAKLAMKEMPDGVILYDTNAKRCFEILKKKAPSIKRIIDVTHINRAFQQEKIFSPIPDEYEDQRKQYRFPAWFLKRMEKENDAVDVFLVPSVFVKDSLLYSGIPENKIKVIPYGSNFEKIEYSERQMPTGKLEFIYVGKVSYAKGIPYLLEAFTLINPGFANLRLIGVYDKNSEIYRAYSQRDNIIFEGAALHDEVLDKLKKADVFVLPSMMEGMSLAGLEAMSCGLPILCTKNSGLDQFVHEDNGFVVDAMDAVKLYDKMMWFINNRDCIPKMSRCAYNTSKQCTWENYNRRLTGILSEM